MAEYIVTFSAAIDIAITADSPKEAWKKAVEMQGEWNGDNYDFDYVTLSEALCITDEDCTEVEYE